MDVRGARPTLTQVFLSTLIAIAIIVAVLFYGLLASTQRSLVLRSERLREDAAARVDASIARDLGEAATVLGDVERAIRTEAMDAHSAAHAEPHLFELILEHPNVADITLTHPERWQISLFRASSDPTSGVLTRIVSRDGSRFVADVRARRAGATLRDGVVTREDATDPTAHPTYETTVSQGIYGTAIWSDLHYSELDRALPETERRVVVTLQKALDDSHGNPVGVVRVGLLAGTIDEIAQMRVDPGAAIDPHLVFLCDADGRLVTRLAPGDRLAPSGSDLRVVPAELPREVARALASPKLHEVSPERPIATEAFTLGGRRFLLTLRALEHTQGWIAAILVPEDHYTRDLIALRNRFVFIGAIGAFFALLGGAFVLVRLRGGFAILLTTTSRMRDFDFAPDARPTALRDVDEVMRGLERAKTALRALGKYVPVDLVRELYGSNREPTLGGELMPLTLMFTDIRGFSDLSERLSPNELARALGSYFDAMTNAIRSTGGTIDKFIGDAVMAMWNAPSRIADHPRLACRAALACVDATSRLYSSPEWGSLPPLVTRFGIHTDEVLVGHFGTSSRLSYTALGDGVNLASRLESLGKQYGVTRIVSGAVEREARGSFAFRRLDRVAVKGRTRAVFVFELLGHADVTKGTEIQAYERALELYFSRDFVGAIAILDAAADTDPPSSVLRDRCRTFIVDPPPPDWSGVWVARSK